MISHYITVLGRTVKNDFRFINAWILDPYLPTHWEREGQRFQGGLDGG
jgi:hypothetical protein